jgi:multicomponent Na+:H+ antiporter subunit B
MKENGGKWEKFFKWINGETTIDSVILENSRKKRFAKRKLRHQKAKFIALRFKHSKRRIQEIICIIVAVVFIGILLKTASELPTCGKPDNPVNNEVSERYLEKGVEETGSINLVSGMILDYRAFDTFGESCVLFTAVICVAMLLKRDKNNIDPIEDQELKEDEEIKNADGSLILKFVARLVIPFIFLYGIYVILNGHLSPGGGFSGGAIIGAGLMLYSTAYGQENTRRFFTYETFKKVSATCLLIYCFSKGYSFFTGGNHLKNIIPKGIPGNILSSGLILPLNICVGIIVACTMYGIYSFFTKGDI